MTNKIIKNGVIILVLIVGALPSIFEGNTNRVNWWLFIDDPVKTYWAAHFYSEQINFALLAFLIMFPKGVNKWLARFLLIITLLDLVHLIAVKKLVFGEVKILAALIISMIIDKIKGKNVFKRI